MEHTISGYKCRGKLAGLRLVTLARDIHVLPSCIDIWWSRPNLHAYGLGRSKMRRFCGVPLREQNPTIQGESPKNTIRTLARRDQLRGLRRKAPQPSAIRREARWGDSSRKLSTAFSRHSNIRWCAFLFPFLFFPCPNTITLIMEQEPFSLLGSESELQSDFRSCSPQPRCRTLIQKTLHVLFHELH